MNLLDSSCVVTQCRATEGILSGMVIYGPQSRPAFIENEACGNRESGIFVFAGVQPRIADNVCRGSHHFGIAVRDPVSHPELVRNRCRENMLSGILLFHHAEALETANVLAPNPRGTLVVTDQPLRDIGR